MKKDVAVSVGLFIVAISMFVVVAGIPKTGGDLANLGTFCAGTLAIVLPIYFRLNDNNAPIPEEAIDKITKINKQNEVDRSYEFYAVIYSPSKKVMALTGKKTLQGMSEEQLCHNYLSWNQVKSGNLYFKSLAEARDRKAKILENPSNEEIQKVVKTFVSKGYRTGSKLGHLNLPNK
ncbi:hypothetical protein GTG28_21120 [Vibrio sp. OCN044]|uniref:Uncharacterized protein n=1 Tax=Vibrio tetraodonis subsp. pristinus TaxID=2695891 RepID=A0A6L8M2D3_9VIBR|nr:hypothetical protein [Vibrio tetraodonis]MYM61706.1 hypothetical protein [Vibrio tetraodonis subsp. pristinus]